MKIMRGKREIFKAMGVVAPSLCQCTLVSLAGF